MEKRFETRIIPLSRLESNRGQVEGLPKNPRVIKDARFEALKKSLKEHPDMLSYRELIVWQPEAWFNRGRYLIIGGNMRHRAMVDAGFKDAPCKVIPSDTDIETLKAYIIKDNGEFGRWDMDALANEWDSADLEDIGIDLGLWQTKGQDLDTNTEIDTDEFNEHMVLKIEMSPEDYAIIGSSLEQIDPESKEKALLIVTGWEEE